MTVQELIDELQKVEDKTQEVVDDLTYTPIIGIEEQEGILGKSFVALRVDI